MYLKKIMLKKHEKYSKISLRNNLLNSVVFYSYIFIINWLNNLLLSYRFDEALSFSWKNIDIFLNFETSLDRLPWTDYTGSSHSIASSRKLAECGSYFLAAFNRWHSDAAADGFVDRRLDIATSKVYRMVVRTAGWNDSFNSAFYARGNYTHA